MSIQKVHATLRKAGIKRSKPYTVRRRYNGPKFGGMTSGYTAKKDGATKVRIYYRALSDFGHRNKMEEMMTVLRTRFEHVELHSEAINSGNFYISYLLVY